ncbi:winged helix-turn-helix domain-containing protein [Bradyrhizobium sp. Arg68]|uniref:winged helix-turn-helix domain-containing tetratricopeptide repeat protein n=1 Tax=Bradyrhizobium ivorense TaxID=2511166 RepID=UPI0027E3288C|nr:winged helix-turn-helix domain-containing protein [Bradyrhizobium ivorense]MCC8937521.1 winged helix-turn-helix domain-containing protein [Bradyrhizobium ivorense]
MPKQHLPVYAYQDWEIDLARRELRLRGAAVPIGSRAFEIIGVLVEAAGDTIDKYDLMGRVWPGAVVEENTLQFHISAIRKAFGPDREMLKTAFGRGYRLVGKWAIRKESPPATLEQPHTASQPLLNAALEPLALPDKPSIAVLPFQNMSGDPEQEYFADGIVEDIITALTRFKSLFVIARNSSFTFKGKPVDIKHVGRQLGVRYVLEGSVRKAANRVRITGQLIDAATNNHLWADKFDGAIEDIFTLQDQVTAAVVALIAPAVERAEIERVKRKPTDRLDSYDLYLRGLALQRTGSFVEARALHLKAIERDPGNARAYANLALTYITQQATSGIALSEEESSEAIRLANSAANLAADDALPLAQAAHVLTYIGRSYDRGSSMTAEAVALNANHAFVWLSRGWVTLMCDEPERALESFERVLRVDPLDPNRRYAWMGIAFALFCLGRYAEGCEWATRAAQLHPEAHSLGALIINSIGAGRIDDARDAAAHLLQLRPDFRVSHSGEVFRWRSAATRELIAKALHASGLPP